MSGRCPFDQGTDGYDVKMTIVQRAWEDWNPTLFLETLGEQRPEKQGGADRRGFEWNYWRRKFASGHRTLVGHSQTVRSVAFSPDGARIASVDQTVKVWDAATGQETLALDGHAGPVWSVGFSPDGHRLASGGGTIGKPSEVRIWDARPPDPGQ